VVAPQPSGRSLVVSIGVDRYDDPAIPNLNWAVADATAFYSAVTADRAPRDLDALLLTNAEATLRGVRHVLGDWLADAKSADNVVVFYAGHGARELAAGNERQPDAYLLPADADFDGLYSSALSLRSELPRILDRIDANNIIVLLDCCLSGSSRSQTADGMTNRGLDGPMLRRVEAHRGHILRSAVSLTDGSLEDLGDGLVVLTACGPNQSALESNAICHGIFTHALLTVSAEVRNADARSIPMGHLYERTADLVRELSGGAQLPMLDGRLSGQRFYVGGRVE
jgi:uncharacterized caspase-like protein